MASKDLINQLKAGGMSYAEIGRKLGRDSSLISQIARGKKKGSNLEASLEDIKEKRSVKEPERRVNKQTGKPQALRKSKQSTPKGLIKDKKGRLKFAPESARESVAVNRLEKIAGEGGKVSFIVTIINGDGEEQTVNLFDKNGMFAQRIFQELRHTGQGLFDWLADKVSEIPVKVVGGKSELIDVAEILSVGIRAIY